MCVTEQADDLYMCPECWGLGHDPCGWTEELLDEFTEEFIEGKNFQCHYCFGDGEVSLDLILLRGHNDPRYYH